uniref:IF rod domain-containing protein n=1 Tax=Mandrillus leucophaeus TaxID=9568 RepID=A0A2K5YX72_MANLE
PVFVQKLGQHPSSAACSSASSLGLCLAYRLPLASDGLDLSQAAACTDDYKIIRTNEKEQLQALNDRLAVFIKKVHHLETQNRALKAEVAALRQRHAQPSCVGELFQRELRDLRAQLEEDSSARAQAVLERDGLAEEVQLGALKAQQRDMDGATLARLDLEKKLESLLNELAFVRQVHDEEVAELLATLQASSQAAAEVDVTVAKPDLTSALREIRAQYESLAAKNLQSAEEWYKSKFANLNAQAARSTEAIRTSGEEIHEHRRQLQARTSDIEGLRGANESLERQILELEEQHSAGVAGYQGSIGQLENDLRNTKSEMALHIREYQDLLNVKNDSSLQETWVRHFGAESTSQSKLSNPQFYNLQVSSTGLSLKKEEEEASKVASKKTSQIEESFEEILEETVIPTKKTEKSNIEETTLSSQKI